MLALEARATLQNLDQGSRLFKVADLQDFAQGSFPIERMLLDLRSQERAHVGASLLGLPWAGFLIREMQVAPQARLAVSFQGDPGIVKPGDVIELQPERAKLAVRYRRGANGNVLFATERCNSFCLMCSQPPRRIDDEWRIEHLCALVDLIDHDEPSLAISGGEPTLLGEGLHRIISRAGQVLPRTHLHVLSNGRRFGEDYPAELFRECHPSLSWGIPLYADVPWLHDYVVQSQGAYAQTLRGLYALQEARQHVEVRVVLVKPVVERLQELARFICRNLPFVEHVALMGVEPIGLALANHDALWLDPSDAGPALEAAVGMLTTHGLPTSIYNTALCTLPRSLWPYARRSISDWKQDYDPACSACLVRQKCGGFFGWKAEGWRSRAIAPITMEQVHA